MAVSHDAANNGLTIGGVPLKIKLRRAERRRKFVAFGLTAPLLLFMMVTFVYPILAMLSHCIKSPELLEVWPTLAPALVEWDGASLPPPPEVLKAMVVDFDATTRSRTIGKAAKRLNYHYGGFRSFVMKTGKRLMRAVDQEGLAAVRDDPALFDRLVKIDKRWADRALWSKMRQASPYYTAFFLLRSVDRDYGVEGEIVGVPDELAVHVTVFWRTIWISAVVTILCLLLGYPIAFLLANTPTRQSNILILLLLLPFWTSLLVRTTAWLVLLQHQGVVNDAGILLDFWDEPLTLVRNRLGTYIGMVHIMLPFMALPLFSVMKRIDPYHMKAAASLGGKPVMSFIKVYLPQTKPGVGAGVLLVFIICLGFYLTPALIGGPADQMLSYYVVFQAGSQLNWGLASSLSLLLMSIVVVFLIIYHRTIGLSNSEFR